MQRRKLSAAICGVALAGLANVAQAVGVNPDGVGQVLLYPYYTVRSDLAGNVYNTLMSVVNTTPSAKAVRVRFNEGRNGREVLAFNLFLSASDTWTAALVPSGTGGTRLLTVDRSCTLPALAQDSASGAFIAEFANAAYLDDGGGTSLDRTREGFVEIIEMATHSPMSVTATNVTHVGGTPPGCPNHVNAGSLNDMQAAGDASPPSGGLMGGITLVNVTAGTAYSAEAVALDDFNHAQSLYQPATAFGPTLADVSPPVSTVDYGTLGVSKSTWQAPIDAVSAVLMRDNVYSEYVLDSGTASGTDWVLTFPTKGFYIAPGPGSNPAHIFQRIFNQSAGACDDVSINIYDREEQTSIFDGFFGPPPIFRLCWAANIVPFTSGGTTNLLGSADRFYEFFMGPGSEIGTINQNGWLRLGFFPATVFSTIHVLFNDRTSLLSRDGTLTTGLTRTYFGLPVIGFMVQSFNNGTLVVSGKNVLSSYGGSFSHSFTRRIE